MDITRRFGRLIVGSSPAGRTNRPAANHCLRLMPLVVSGRARTAELRVPKHEAAASRDQRAYERSELAKAGRVLPGAQRVYERSKSGGLPRA